MPYASLSLQDCPAAYGGQELEILHGFHRGLASAAEELLKTHLALPREVHYVADLQRWILSQITLALHFEHRRDPRCPPISPRNLVLAVAAAGIASRNTIHGFLMEMRRYRFVTPLETADRRERAVCATLMSEQLIRRYFDIHLRALDLIDDGHRHALSLRHPDLLEQAQPRFAWLLLETRDWHKPAPSIVKFVRSVSGSSVLHELVKAAPALPHEPPGLMSPIWIGQVSPNALSRRYRISRTHTARLFENSRQAGLIGWARKSNRGECWISPRLVHDYRHWQALKLAAVSRAFREACLHAAGDRPAREAESILQSGGNT